MRFIYTKQVCWMVAFIDVIELIPTKLGCPFSWHSMSLNSVLFTCLELSLNQLPSFSGIFKTSA